MESNVYGLFELDGYGGNMTWLGNFASRDDAVEELRDRESRLSEPKVLLVLVVAEFGGGTA